MNLIKYLREARVRAGMSQGEIADKLGVSQATISNWERGKGQPTSDQIGAIDTMVDLKQASEGASQPSALGAWLAKTRLAKGWSIPELAHHSGLTPAAIYRIEAGVTRNLRVMTRNKLEKALGSPLPDDAREELAAEAEVVGLGPLEDFDPHVEGDRPAEPGIYVFYDISDRPIYVGEALNVKKRIKDHEEKFWFKSPIVESASWIKVADADLRRKIETLLIKFLKSNAVINKQCVDR